MNGRAISCYAVLAALFFAGCLSGTPPTQGEQPVDVGESSSPSPRRSLGGTNATVVTSKPYVDLADCAYYASNFHAPKAIVSDHVPPEYEPVGFAPDLVQINLHLWSCEHFAIANETVGRGLTYAATLVRVNPPEAAAVGADIHYYNTETYVSDEALATLLAEKGAPVAVGKMSSSRDEATLNAVVKNGEETIYEIAAGYGLNAGTPETLTLRHHFTGPSGGHAWVDVEQVSQLTAWPGPVVLTLESGFLSDMWAEAPPAMLGVGADGTVTATLTLHEAQVNT